MHGAQARSSLRRVLIGLYVFSRPMAGAPPFVGDNPLATMLKHQTAEPVTLKQATLGNDFSPDLERAIARMLAKDPGERYQDLLQVADDLICIKGGVPLDSVRAKQKPIEKKKFSKTHIAVGVFVLLFIGPGSSRTSFIWRQRRANSFSQC